MCVLVRLTKLTPSLHRDVVFFFLFGLPGDQIAIARETASQLGMGNHILNTDALEEAEKNGDTHIFEKADGFAQVNAPFTLITRRPRKHLTWMFRTTCNYDVSVITNVFFLKQQVYPEHKYNIVAGLQKLHHVVGMTGDGVNDGTG